VFDWEAISSYFEMDGLPGSVVEASRAFAMAEDQAQQDPLLSFLKGLPPDQAEGVIESFVRKAQPAIENVLDRTLPPAIERFLKNRGFTEEVAGLVHMLAARSNDAKEGVLEKALTLYGLALDAREKGNRLAIISPEDFIVHEVVGFEPANLAPAKATG
jgi:hypothetical protein